MKDDSWKVQTDMGTVLPTTNSWEWSAQSQLETDIHDGFSILNFQASISSLADSNSTFTRNGPESILNAMPRKLLQAAGEEVMNLFHDFYSLKKMSSLII